jgi:two-component system nitrogen regulation response regulator NtrX
MEEGRFRQDLFYRLNVIPLRIAPLRERKEDIPMLINRFLKEFSVKEGEAEKTMTPDAVDLLMEHNWPGNVRELKNITERLFIMTTANVITAGDIPALFREGDQDLSIALEPLPDSYKEAKWYFEKRFIEKKLREFDGNISRTAESIGLERSNLHRKIRNYGLDVKSAESDA